MRRSLGLFVTLVVIAAACGARQDGVAAPQPAAPSAALRDVLFISRDDGTAVVGGKAGAVTASLPRGAATPDWTIYWAVEPGERTTLRELDPVTGADKRTFAIDGRWALPTAYGAAPAGFSADGRWLVLAGPQSKDGAAVKSSFAIIDTANGALARTVRATGDYTFDAISADGRNLYVIEHLGTETVSRWPSGYRVRVAGEGSSTLSESLIVDIKIASPQMNGLYHSSVARTGSAWNYGLYFHPTKGAFIHALNTTQLYAQCILDVPDGGSGVRPAWSMLLSPEGGHLYVVNGPAGIIADVGPESLQTNRKNVNLVPAIAVTERAPAHGAAITSDGSRVYAIGERGILVINTADLTLKARYLDTTPVRSLALSPDGQRLYVLAEDGSLIRLEASTGRPVETLAPVRGATALLRVQTR
jgi:DNA-binding beta-propeller fold protein YncE